MLVNQTMLLSEIPLNTFPLFCIYAFVDESKKAMSIHFSETASIVQITKIIYKLRQGVHCNRELQDSFDRGSLSLKVIEAFDKEMPDVLLRTKCFFYLKNSGYKEMGAVYTGFTYKLHKRVLSDFRDESAPPLIYVYIRSNNQGNVVLGVFDNMVTADSWINMNYAGHTDTGVLQLHFCKNELTPNYHSVMGYVLPKIPHRKIR